MNRLCTVIHRWPVTPLFVPILCHVRVSTLKRKLSIIIGATECFSASSISHGTICWTWNPVWHKTVHEKPASRVNGVITFYIRWSWWIEIWYHCSVHCDAYSEFHFIMFFPDDWFRWCCYFVKTYFEIALYKCSRLAFVYSWDFISKNDRVMVQWPFAITPHCVVLSRKKECSYLLDRQYEFLLSVLQWKLKEVSPILF